MKKDDGHILAVCDTCARDEFLIFDWEDTPWAGGQQNGVPLKDLASAHGLNVPDSDEADDSDDECKGDDQSLAQILSAMKSPLSAKDVRALIAKSDHPGTVVQAIMSSIPGGPDRKDVDRFLPVIMDAWNTTPRGELGGRTPSQVYVQPSGSSPSCPAPLNQGRNRSCPCGSGKKYKRCCGANAN